MQGIRVGSVTGFRISPRRPGSVEVLIRVDGTTPVRQSTHATVERHLLTGIASILLVNSTEESPRLTETPPNEPYPVIAEGESEYKLTESAAYMAQRADETMQRINRLLSDENQEALSKILVNLERISANADRTMARLDGTLTTPNRRGEEKARCLQELVATREDSDTFAYGNAESDLAHLKLARHGVLVNGTLGARRAAAELGVSTVEWI